MKIGNLVAVLGLFLTSPLLAAEKAKAAAPDQTLAAGTYTATVQTIVCEGCGPFIQETLQKNKSLETIAVDPTTRTVSFSVKKGAAVKLSDLQVELKKSADLMGMGANYTLSDLKKAGQKS